MLCSQYDTNLGSIPWTIATYLEQVFLPTPDIEAHLQILSELVEIQSFKDNPTKWSNTLKQFDNSTNYLSVFVHFVGLALKRLSKVIDRNYPS